MHGELISLNLYVIRDGWFSLVSGIRGDIQTGPVSFALVNVIDQNAEHDSVLFRS